MEGVEGRQFSATTTTAAAAMTSSIKTKSKTTNTITATVLAPFEDEQNELPILMPSKIGREFVRQYYRLLYKAPEMLYRFYTNDSTCTHSQSEMVVGKRDIQYLFRRQNHTDCHTKILHTDIHGTLANGVMVMVTGEQYSVGRPARPFVQTFVLAAQAPRRYYVYNDIFRYTDFFEKPRSAVEDAECQTSSMHLGDGDQHKYKQRQQLQQMQQHHQQHQQQQQLQHHQLQEEEEEDDEVGGEIIMQHEDIRLNESARVFGYEKITSIPTDIGHNCSERIHVPISEGCAIPMPRWANARQNKEPAVASIYTNYSQQDHQHTNQHGDNNINNVNNNNIINNNNNNSNNNSNNNHSHNHHGDESYDDYLSASGQAQNPDCPFYRSLIAQALSPRMELEEMVSHMSNQYGNSNYYNGSEDVSRVSIGVTSGRISKRRSECTLGLKPTHHLYSRDAKDSYQESTDQHLVTNDAPDKVPTYAKLLMSAFTRASLKNNDHQQLSLNTSTIATPLKATNISIFTKNNKQQTNDIDNSNSNLPSTIIDPHNNHHHHNHNHEVNYATTAQTTKTQMTTTGFTPAQRTNYNTSGGMRRNDRRRASSAQKYDDNQQLFLGQIPHNATEDELINIFSCFGNVLELRILPNLGGKIQPGAKHPLKYGFLTFEHVESVKACLENRPVYFPNNSPDGQKLNVRAKKPSVSRDEMSPAYPALDSQSLGNEWLKGSARRNNSVSNNFSGIGGNINNGNNGGISTTGASACTGTGNGNSNVSGVNPLINNNSNNSNNNNIVYNRKDNRNNRGVSLDSGPPIQGGKKFVQPAGGGGTGCGRR